MKKILAIICAVIIISCNAKQKAKGEFEVSGEIKNAPDQKIYLEEVFFSQKQPQVIDTAQLKKGRFTVKGIAPEEGMYRLRLEKGPGYIFINDAGEIPASIDATGTGLLSAEFKSPSNKSLAKFLIILDSLQTGLKVINNKISLSKQSKENDSVSQILQNNILESEEKYKSFILTYVDTTNSPVMALFALGYTNGIDPALIDKSVAGITKKFPEHKGLNQLINQYRSEQEQNKNQVSAPSAQNTVAAEIALPDTAGKIFSLSSLKGKFVLVDFWASWCGPCREENPNVVAAYKKFKDKNFTILGVSLDREKADWVKAINDDGLTWHHVSDLKFWNSVVVPLYKIEGIPYNVLVDPEGKIIANSLRGNDLENKLAEVLK